MRFDAAGEVKRLKAKAQLRRKKRYSRSKLDKYTYEILALRAQKATLEQIQLYLAEKRISCEQSTIQRFLKKHTNTPYNGNHKE